MILCSFQRAKFICMMGRKGALSETEKFKIIERHQLGKIDTLEITKELGCDHRTVKKFVITQIDVLTKGKFGSKHLFCMKLCARSTRKSGVTLCKLVKKCLKALVFLVYPNQLDAVS